MLSSRRTLTSLALVLTASLSVFVAFPRSALGQVTFLSRNGMNTVYCGAAFGGPGIQHIFPTIADTPGDDIAVNAGPPACGAAAHFEAHPSPNSFVLAQSGNSHRDGPGVVSVADGRDSWEFTLASPTCFTLSVSLDLSGNSIFGSSATFNLVGTTPGLMTLSDGTVVGGLSQGLANNGHFAMTWSGTMRPGRYSASLGGRSDPNNVVPYDGAYACAFSLTFGSPSITSSPAPATICRTGTATFAVIAAGAGTLQWQVEDAAVPGGWANILNGTNMLSTGGRFGAQGATTSTLTMSHAAGVDVIQLAQARVRCRVTSFCGSTTSDSAVLTVCVADMDDGTGSGTCDGGVTIDDLLFDLLQFENGDLRADVDDGTSTGTPDGGVTIDDLLYYLLRFESGC